ncbi:metal-dependent hydrolase [Candidatus Pacearchaeota archaeon]|nr:metal-dependent hydrolase [Candidatus Pacearchaeota archaeon]
MMMRTHLALGALAGVILLPYVTHKISFIPIILLASLLPDIDSMHSYLGKYWIFRPMQWFVKHRGMLHSLTFCLLVSFIFAAFSPFLVLPFFIGYGLHLFSDSLTIEGIQIWWPKGRVARGNMLTGGRVEKILFIAVCLAIAIFILRLSRLI